MSLSVEFRVTGLDDMLKWIDDIPDKLQIELSRALDEAAENVRETASDMAPVRTGFLRASVVIFEVEQWVRKISATAHYASFVEFGTIRMAAKPFMRPALHSSIPQIYALLEKVAEVSLR